MFVVGNYLAYAEFPIVNESYSSHVGMLYCASLADRDGVLLMPALGTYLLVLLLI